MITDEELDKTMQESQELIDKAEKMQREVEMMKTQAQELYEQYNVNHDDIKSYLKEGEMTPQQRKALEEEMEKLDMELEEEIRIAQDRYKMEKMASSGAHRTTPRRMRQMV